MWAQSKYVWTEQTTIMEFKNWRRLTMKYKVQSIQCIEYWMLECFVNVLSCLYHTYLIIFLYTSRNCILSVDMKSKKKSPVYLCVGEKKTVVLDVECESKKNPHPFKRESLRHWGEIKKKTKCGDLKRQLDVHYVISACIRLNTFFFNLYR